MAEACAANIFCATVVTAASGWVIIPGVTAARAAASAAALSKARFRIALEKSSPMPTSSVIGMSENANRIAALPLRSRPKPAIGCSTAPARGVRKALRQLRNRSNTARMAMRPYARLDPRTQDAASNFNC